MSKEDLASSAEELEKDLEALRNGNPLRVRPELWYRVFSVAGEIFHLPISRVLGLADQWEDHEDYNEEQASQVIAAACQKADIFPGQYWEVVRRLAQSELEQVKKKLERRRRALERQRLLASLPDEDELQKIRRYEAHLSRQFYRALHELQRVQSARAGQRPPTPIAVGIDIDSSQPAS
ncbi:MAG: hypothetical protein ACE5JL_00430 [Dehalococcoidia bacterium]